jgi:UDP-glucuronate 4-epimerase
MKILVTGAAGFIGSSVSQRLLERGDQVVGFDNFDPFYARTIKEANLKALESPAFDFQMGDLLDNEALRSCLKGVDGAIHLAALAGVRPSLENPTRYMRVNVEGTTTLLQACQELQINRLVVASSSSVYGPRTETPFRENDACDRPASPYAASKKATELACATYHHLYNLGITCLRFFTVYGPRQRPEMAIHKFVRLAMNGEAIPMFGDGTSGRDYTYIDDIVDGTVAAFDRQRGDFQVYNLGGSNPVLLRELIDAIGNAIGKPVDLEQKPWQPGDVPVTSADVSLAQKDLGYSPKVDLAEGLKRFVTWYREQNGE